MTDRFRDQLAEALARFHGYDADDVLSYTMWRDQADALMPVIAAEMEACAAEREAEVLEAAARWLESGPDHGGPGPPARRRTPARRVVGDGLSP